MTELNITQATALLEQNKAKQLGQRELGWEPAIFFASIAVVVLLIALSLLPRLFTPYDPLATNLLNVLKPPSWAHPLGTDNLGRDTWSRILHGGRASLVMGLGAVAIGVVLGSLIGAIAALSGRLVDGLLSRVLDVLFAFPDLLLALVIIAVLGAGENNTMLALGLAGVPTYARVLRGEILKLKNTHFYDSSISLGIGRPAAVLRHVLPNALSPVVILGTMNIGRTIIGAAGLSFLGLGTKLPEPEWGLMLASGRSYMMIAPWLSIAPGLVITIAVCAFTLLGRGLNRRIARIED